MTAPDQDERALHAQARLANVMLLRQIRAWLARDAAERRLQARAWRWAWVFLAIGMALAVYYALRGV